MTFSGLTHLGTNRDRVWLCPRRRQSSQIQAAAASRIFRLSVTEFRRARAAAVLLKKVTPPKPKLFGRGLRIIAGVCALVAGIIVGPFGLWGLLLFFLGASFIAGGLMANTGCEITALPNLLLSEEKRLHCF